MRSLLYLYDPLCGWCYAATPSISRLRAAGVGVSLRPTGLFSDPGRLMTPEFADYAWKNDQRIAALSGQSFSRAYRRQVLQAAGTAFDSSAATLGLTAVSLTQPSAEADGLRVLQEARYIDGRDITDLHTVATILGEAGFNEAAASLGQPSTQLMSTNAGRVESGAASVRELGGSGVPTLAVADGPARRLLDTELLYGDPGALLALFNDAVSA